MEKNGKRIQNLLCGAKKAALLFLALILLAPQLSLAACAAMQNSFEGYTAEAGTMLENFGSFAIFYPEESRAGTAAVIHRLTVPADLYYTDILELGFSVISDNAADRHDVPVTVHLYFTDGTVAEFSAASVSDGTGRMVMDLTNVTGTMQLSSVRILAELKENAYLRVTPITVEKQTSGDFAERFLCGEFTAYRGSVALSDDKLSLALNFYGSAGYAEGTVAAKLENARVNALRFAVMSVSRACKLNVYYSYEEAGEFSEENKASVELERSDSPKTYTVAVKDAENVKRIRISTDATGLTTVTLGSLLAVSAYADSTEYVGKLESCVRTEIDIVLRGTIPTAEVAKHRESVLAVYALPHDRDIISAEDTPIKTASISAKFEIKLPTANDTDTLKYLVVLTDADGNLVDTTNAFLTLPSF